MHAVSAMWNSGRFVSISATMSPVDTPCSRSPSAKRSTCSPYSVHVISRSPPRVRSAIRSPASRTVRVNACATVGALKFCLVGSVSTGLRCMHRQPIAWSVRLSGVEAVAGEPAEIVRKADRRQEYDQHEPDHSGLLHHAEWNRPAAHLLDQAPEDVPAVERQEREQVDHAERQAD